MVAMAKELKLLGRTEAEVHLAVGLPLTWVGEQKDKFRTYFLRIPVLDYNYNGVDYHVELTGVSVYEDVTEETPDGILCGFMYGETEEGYSIMISGVNSDGQFEIRAYFDVTLEQMLFYTYAMARYYSLVQDGLPEGEVFTIVLSYGEDENSIVDSEEEATELADSIEAMLQGASAE